MKEAGLSSVKETTKAMMKSPKMRKTPSVLMAMKKTPSQRRVTSQMQARRKVVTSRAKPHFLRKVSTGTNLKKRHKKTTASLALKTGNLVLQEVRLGNHKEEDEQAERATFMN